MNVYPVTASHGSRGIWKHALPNADLRTNVASGSEVRQHVEVVVRGRKIEGEFQVSGLAQAALVTVFFEGRSKRTQVGDAPALTIARNLLTDLAAS